MAEQRTETEWTTCREHPEVPRSYCWVWDDKDGATVEDSEPEYLDSCSKCEEENAAELELRLRGGD